MEVSTGEGRRSRGEPSRCMPRRHSPRHVCHDACARWRLQGLLPLAHGEAQGAAVAGALPWLALGGAAALVLTGSATEVRWCVCDAVLAAVSGENGEEDGRCLTSQCRLLHPVQLWLVSGGGNANFLYGMNLLWGGLLVVLLLLLVRAAARAPGGGGSGSGCDEGRSEVHVDKPPH